MKLAIVGAGAIGGCLGGWLSQHYDDVYLLDQGEVAQGLKDHGLTLYRQGDEQHPDHVPVKVIDSLTEAGQPDAVVLAVKNYSLDDAARSAAAQIGGDTLVIGLQNGIVNQTVLPRYFNRVIYGIIEFNAWIDEPGVIGYQQKGPFVFGTTEGGPQDQLETLRAYIDPAVPVVVTDRIRDAVYSKMIINLTNSYTTLVGFKFRPIESMIYFKKTLSNSLYEGVQIARAAGVKEFRAGDIPSWRKIWASAKLPDAITMGIFKKSLDKMVLSSMAQDVLQRHSGVSELDSLLGHFVRLAEQHGVAAPYNKTIYRLCRQEFSKPDFVPLTEAEVWQEIQRAS
ncbi:MAG: ketopantoate reductase family protein [Bifidobacteriaceae bacterium]|jgi:2-dehydropantoate 2-reductase|nr:ketopantoate reductase family protein [Bifidobacteriaceae bacterium]